MSSSPIFIPVQGTESKIKDSMLQTGRLYFAVDTGKIYLDTADTRISVGGAGAAIYYASGEATESDELWIIEKSFLTNPLDIPTINDIILNENDGAFYKIEHIVGSSFYCSRIAISGGSGSVTPSKTRPSLMLEDFEVANIINGSDIRLNFTATSMKGEDEQPLNNKLTVTWKLFDGDSENGVMYYSSSLQVDSGVPSYLDLGSYLRDSTTTTIQLIASGNNHDEVSAKREAVITTTNLSLTLSSKFSNKDPLDADKVIFGITATGKVDKVMEVSFDGVVVQTKKLPANETQEDFTITIPQEKCTHGAHSVQVDLYQLINNNKGRKVKPVKFEVAVDAGGSTPMVWLGDYQSTYYTYDNIQIPYLAYDPENPNKATVYLYKNFVQYPDEERTIENRASFAIWEISDANNEATNRYQIACGSTNDAREASMREIIFEVLQDPRNLTVAQPQYLRLNFDPKGRSNSESKSRRSKWSYTDGTGNTINAKFENFNWYNNGWFMDKNNNTFLRISNGAKFSLPIGATRFAGNTSSTQSHTFEIMFKVRNVQDYSDLIKNITRYVGDDKWYADFSNPSQTEYTNYDAYLQALLKGDYDKLEIKDVEKIVNIDNALCKYCVGTTNSNIRGWALGPQDAFFKDNSETVSVAYTEDNLVSLSIVFSYYTYKDEQGNVILRSTVLFYLNGVITGVAYSDTPSFSIDNTDGSIPSIVFDSSNCDIDLYKLRVYRTDLDMKEVVNNYTVDRKDIDNFDLLSLADYNGTINEYELNFNKVIDWNEQHPNNQTMPYIIFDTSNSDDRLPWSKSVSMPATITFVNTQLDKAYANGELEELSGPKGDKLWDSESTAEERANAVKTYYKHHCPSWTGENCELVVQGTSSEYYPRRNYKIKTKTEYDADKKKRVHIFLNKGPFAEDYKTDPESTRQKFWYMNNYTNGTDRWTMKVDYMESSGSYNAGFASLVGNAYTKHPLEDYITQGAINPIVTEDDGSSYNGLTSQVTFTESLSPDPLDNSNIRWEDYRTSLLGFPVMAFHKKPNGSYTFIGYYRMLLDKGSDEVLGFKPAGGVTANFLGGKDVKKIAECWEFSNNNRTYCSYRDPWKRNELSFMPPASVLANGGGLTSAAVPIVADSFEYRYNDNEDYLDILYNLGKYDETEKKWTFAGSVEDRNDFLEKTGIDLNMVDNWDQARQKMIDYYKNWEDVCKWVYSTCVDNVVSMGTYKVIHLGDTEFTTDGSLFILAGFDEEGKAEYEPITSGSFDVEKQYWAEKVVKNETTGQEENKMVVVHVYDSVSVFKYEKEKYYQNINEIYSLVYDSTFNPDIIYYELDVNEEYKKKSDRLIDKNTSEFEIGAEYYTWDPDKTYEEIMGTNADPSPSVVYVGKGIADLKDGEEQSENTITAAQFKKGVHYKGITISYGNRNYDYDTKEYRSDKFINEVASHFDLEYLATYFVMTEVFECYDSRGKNCMMASWGPLKDGGEYIWYPIFYDIDTQLGINNTGIPSFTFNIDATLNDNFSTSDSILWNNFYSYFKGSYILQKYQHLRGDDSRIFTSKLKKPPLESVDKLEKWYLYDPEETNNIAAKGLRPLIVTNLDSWYKYITITNIVGSTNKEHTLDKGLVGYLDRDGKWALDPSGTYFYALQGDRSQSRKAFLTKRLDFINSWLGVGEYARSGKNCIWGRVSANDATDTSDRWRDGIPSGETYWIDEAETKKRHEFDAQYWLDLTPIYSTYITLSDDSAAYPSVKYDGITPVNFKINAIESGVRNSKNYREQLLYIYGSNKMLDIGDMSNLYWREFKIDGQASKLTRLKLGHDGLIDDYYYNEKDEKIEVKNMAWKNDFLNPPSIPAGAGSTGMPLLKEVNFCNIKIQDDSPSLDLRTCEKLEDFRATGSNLASIQFANGVALNTLYLPATIQSLSLTEANLLTSVLKTYTPPTKNIFNELEAIPGLYIESFFEENPTSQLTSIKLKGGSLGYNSFDLFSRFFELRNNISGNRLTMTDINWCPYVQLVDGDVYDSNLEDKYYQDDGHFRLTKYVYSEDKNDEFLAAIVRGEMYYLDDTLVEKSAEVDINTYKALKSLIDNQQYQVTEDGLEEVKSGGTVISNNFKSFDDDQIHAEFSGIIYINNSIEIDESEIANVMKKAYPDLTIFVSQVKEAYLAKFVVLNDDGSYTYVPDINGDTTYASTHTVSQEEYEGANNQSPITKFNNPFESYDPSKSKTHYDFIGWTRSLNPDLVDYSNVLLSEESENWGTNYKGIDWGIIDTNIPTQIYYAVFEGTHYKATFLDKENSNYEEFVEVQYDPNGSYFNDNVLEPISIKTTSEEDRRYVLRGWTTVENYGGSYAEGVDVNEFLTDVSKHLVIGDMTFYAVFQEESVYDSVTNNKYFIFSKGTGENNKTYTKIGLNPENGNNLQGKITLPLIAPDGTPIEGIDVFTWYRDDSGDEILLGKNITHIFFEQPSEGKPCQYKYVENNAFKNMNLSSSIDAYEFKLQSIYLPDTIQRIGDNSFENLFKLQKINLPDSITYIGKRAFRAVNGALHEVQINALPLNLTTLNEGAFQNNSGISINSLPKNIQTLPTECFQNCPNISINKFGNGNNLTSIGKNCFNNSGNNSGVYDAIWINSNVTELGVKCFTNYGKDGHIEQVYTARDVQDDIIQNWINNRDNIFGTGIASDGMVVHTNFTQQSFPTDNSNI